MSPNKKNKNKKNKTQLITYPFIYTSLSNF